MPWRLRERHVTEADPPRGKDAMSARSGEADTSTEDEQQKACGNKIHVSIAYPELALTMIGQDGAMMAQDGAQMGQDEAQTSHSKSSSHGLATALCFVQTLPGHTLATQWPHSGHTVATVFY